MSDEEDILSSGSVEGDLIVVDEGDLEDFDEDAPVVEGGIIRGHRASPQRRKEGELKGIEEELEMDDDDEIDTIGSVMKASIVKSSRGVGRAKLVEMERRKRITCTICGRKITKYLRHLRTVHKYSDFKARELAQSDTSYNRIRSGSGKRPKKACPFTFCSTYAVDILRHMRKFHPEMNQEDIKDAYKTAAIERKGIVSKRLMSGTPEGESSESGSFAETDSEIEEEPISTRRIRIRVS